jgi:hypothetical protein
MERKGPFATTIWRRTVNRRPSGWELLNGKTEIAIVARLSTYSLGYSAVGFAPGRRFLRNAICPV